MKIDIFAVQQCIERMCGTNFVKKFLIDAKMDVKKWTLNQRPEGILIGIREVLGCESRGFLNTMRLARGRFGLLQRLREPRRDE